MKLTISKKNTDQLFSWFNKFQKDRQTAYQSGAALQGHTRSAHQGIFVESCRACQELKRKQA